MNAAMPRNHDHQHHAQFVRADAVGTEAMDGYFNTKFITQTGVRDSRHCEEHLRLSNPSIRYAAPWIASLRSQ
jgi:hypothetical protein